MLPTKLIEFCQQNSPLSACCKQSSVNFANQAHLSLHVATKLSEFCQPNSPLSASSSPRRGASAAPHAHVSCGKSRHSDLHGTDKRGPRTRLLRRANEMSYCSLLQRECPSAQNQHAHDLSCGQNCACDSTVRRSSFFLPAVHVSQGLLRSARSTYTIKIASTNAQMENFQITRWAY